MLLLKSGAAMDRWCVAPGNHAFHLDCIKAVSPCGMRFVLIRGTS